MQESPTEPSDGAVVARVKAGDREAYRILVRRYQDGLYRHALRMIGHADTAADLVQGALVKAYSHIHRCRDPERFGAWLFRILANRCKDHLKSRRRKDVSLDSVDVPPARSAENPALDAERQELRKLLRRALDRLPPIQRRHSCSSTSRGCRTKRFPSDSTCPYRPSRCGCSAPVRR